MYDKKNILFRSDSSSSIGLGHIKRDLVLATEYKNSTITFAVQDLDGNINQEIINQNYKLEILESNDINELISLINKNTYDLLIIDSYQILYKDEKRIKEKTECTIMVLDDTYEKHYCDILLNHNIYAQEKEYINLVPRHCEIRCGKEYTLIRDEFRNYKRKKDKKQKTAKKILICMGGVDEQNMSLDILNVLKDFDINIIILTSSSNKNINTLKKEISDTIDVIIDSKNMAELIYEVDFAIVSPSVIVQEILFMKKEFITIQTALNQEYMHKYLSENKYLCMSEFNEQDLKRNVLKLLRYKSE